MRTEQNTIRTLFAPLTPTTEQRERMWQNIQSYVTEQKGEPQMKRTKRTPMRTILVAAVVVLLLTGCVCAAVPAVRNYLNTLFLQEDSVGRIDTVPEGWTGIYTADDLEAIRKDLGGNYILMNDITIPDEYYAAGNIYENGFTPIGGEYQYGQVTDADGSTHVDREDVRLSPFTGVFNGNGYVIANVHITGTPTQGCIGLFGKCEMVSGIAQDSTPDSPQRAFSGGIIKNLGVVDSSIDVTIDMAGSTALHIGMIAGECDVLAGCFTDNVTVSIQLQGEVTEDTVRNYANLRIGGVAGSTILTDSCYSTATVTVTKDADAIATTPYVAGVTGFTSACVTSYFAGDVTTLADTEAAAVAGFDVTTPPHFLSETVMKAIAAKIPDEMSRMKLQSFYSYFQSKDLQMYITTDLAEADQIFYMLDPMTKERERKELSKILAEAFPGEVLIAYCQENGVKYGAYHNYDLRTDKDCTFEGFDFDTIWKMGDDGTPKLRLFTWSRETGVTTYNSHLDGVIRK